MLFFRFIPLLSIRRTTSFLSKALFWVRTWPWRRQKEGESMQQCHTYLTKRIKQTTRSRCIEVSGPVFQHLLTLDAKVPIYYFLKMGQSRPLFVYFCPFPITISIQIEKSVDGVLGIQTWGRSMVGADETTELWRPPNVVQCSVLSCRKCFFCKTIFIELHKTGHKKYFNKSLHKLQKMFKY